MGSTEGPQAERSESLAKDPAPARAAAEPGPIQHNVVALGERDLIDALALSASARWNQNDADWRMLLSLGQGWGIRCTATDGRTRLAASTVVLPYGDAFAWVSMVLVLPEFQRRGFATHLLRHALGTLAARSMAALLDATPAGHPVYLREGFRDAWGFARYRRERDAGNAGAPLPNPPSCVQTSARELRDSDWPAIEALDTPAFGASRLPLLRALAQRLPQAARVAEAGGRLRGFVFGRDGRDTSQIGPLVADADDIAIALIADALRATPGPVYIDLLDRHRTLLPWLQEQGFVFQRPFTRMAHAAPGAPGHSDAVVLVAGPELG